MNTPVAPFPDLDALVADLRDKLADKKEGKKYLLLFAYNSIGKTRLSMAFKEAGKHDGGQDTLYFNAFTEDLFVWDNDLEYDNQRMLKLNTTSRFFQGLESFEMETRIREFLSPFSDFDFRINTDNWTITFSRNIQIPNDDGSVENEVAEDIKISRGEERLFVWCFFLTIAELAIDAQEEQAYDWVKYLYIDDPISSLDDNNAIEVASRLAQLLKKSDGRVKTVVSSHHTLFFNVLCNELSRPKRKLLGQYFLSKDEATGDYGLRYTDSTPFFHHVAMLKVIKKAADTGLLYNYHFGILRNLLEKSATFHGYNNFSACIQPQDDDPDGIIYARLINLLSHGDYSHFEPAQMQADDRQDFSQILKGFMSIYRFNPDLFSEDTTPEAQT